MEHISKTIDEKINSLLKLHNGRCEAVSLEDNVLSIVLHGGCVGCPSSKLTLLQLINPIIKEAHPEIVDIVLMV